MTSKIVFIVDWDDTCLPTSALSVESRLQKCNINEVVLSPSLKVLLSEAEQATIRFLGTLRKHGSIFIVTNSQTGWVYESACKFYPRLAPSLTGPNSIPIISAIDLYKLRSGVADPDTVNRERLSEWKYFAISRLLSKINRPVSLFSIGDSEDERSAVLRISTETSDLYPRPIQVKACKLNDSPSILTVTNQLKKVTENMDKLIATDKFDIIVSK